MSQVSRPLQIVLAATVLMFMLWFVALRPKPEPAAPPATPQAAAPTNSALPGALGDSVDKARDAGTTSDEANARAGADPTEASGGSQAAKPTTKKLPSSVAGVAVFAADQAGALIVPVKKAFEQPQKASLPADAKRALDKGKVLVLLFWNGKSSDDKFVRSAVRSLSTHKGKVFKDVSRLSAIGRYSAVTNGVPVLGSPTVIVVGKKKSAVSFTGYVDATNIDQAVLAALG